jgi:hypothetical protein
VVLGVGLCSFAGMVGSVLSVSMRGVRVMRSCFVVSRFVMLPRLSVMTSGVLVMVGCFIVMIGCFFDSFRSP